jgi:hypothetical protein
MLMEPYHNCEFLASQPFKQRLAQRAEDALPSVTLAPDGTSCANVSLLMICTHTE